MRTTLATLSASNSPPGPETAGRWETRDKSASESRLPEHLGIEHPVRPGSSGRHVPTGQPWRARRGGCGWFRARLPGLRRVATAGLAANGQLTARDRRFLSRWEVYGRNDSSDGETDKPGVEQCSMWEWRRLNEGGFGVALCGMFVFSKRQAGEARPWIKAGK